MSKMFYRLEEAAEALGVTVEELEEMFSLGELEQVTVGTKRRLVRVRDVEAALERVRSGGRLRTRREFRAASIPGAVEKAAGALGIEPMLISYQILERANDWTPDSAAKEARIAVDLPEDAPPEDAASTHEETPAPKPSARDAGEDARSGESRLYYAPEQVARLLGVSAHEINLRIYRKELPTANINGYRWVPKEALDEMLKELSPPELPDPPSAFLILTAPTPEDESTGLGTREVGDLPPIEEILRVRVGELEEQVEDLKRELRLEKARRIREPGGDRVG